MKFSKELIRQVILYGLIGISCALLDLLAFTFLFKILSINEFIANVFSIHLGIITSFILNRKFNFKRNDRIWFRAILFYLTGLFGLLLSEGLLWLGTVCLSFSVMPVKVVVVFGVGGTQFIINRAVAFRKQAGGKNGKTLYCNTRI